MAKRVHVNAALRRARYTRRTPAPAIACAAHAALGFFPLEPSMPAPIRPLVRAAALLLPLAASAAAVYKWKAADGASMNLNYPIPIGRALTAVGAGIN